MMSDCSELLGQSIKICSSGSVGNTEQHPIKHKYTHKPKNLRNTNESKQNPIQDSSKGGHPFQRTQMKCPRQFYWG